jgi:hypothetical protein
VGAALESLLVFPALAAGIGLRPVYLAIGSAALAGYRRLHGKHSAEPLPALWYGAWQAKAVFA